jgi:hypothetical protein
MMLQTIDLATLSTVHGGQDAPNKTKVEGEISVKTPAIDVNGKGSYEAQRTDYAHCLDTLKGRSPEEIRATCGTPPKKGE